MIISSFSSYLQNIINEFDIIAPNLSNLTKNEKIYILGAACALIQRRK